MENRSVVKVLVLSIVTFGIYAILWFFWTTKELKARGADIPTAWLMFVPIANFYFYYKYFMGAEHVTGGAVNGILYFVLGIFVSPVVSQLLAQSEFNKIGGAAPVMGGMPMNSAPMGGMPAAQPMMQAPAPQAQMPMAPEAPQDPNQMPPQPPLVQ